MTRWLKTFLAKDLSRDADFERFCNAPLDVRFVAWLVLNLEPIFLLALVIAVLVRVIS